MPLNYLTHFFHNHKILLHPLTAGEYYWGAVFPDMARVYDRGLRIRLPEINKRIHHPQELSFWNGIRNHLQTDQVFHHAPLFFRLQKAYADCLLAAAPELPCRQQRIIAHLGIELLYDHYLHTNDPEMTARFYDTLDSVPEGKWILLVNSLFGETDGLEKHLRRFMDTRFLFKYDDMDFLAEVMLYKMQIPNDGGSTETAMIIRKSFEEMRAKVFDSFPELKGLLKTVR